MFAINAKAAYFFIQEAGKRMTDGGKISTIVTSLLAAFTGLYSNSATPRRTSHIDPASRRERARTLRPLKPFVAVARRCRALAEGPGEGSVTTGYRQMSLCRHGGRRARV
jgi:hypothetical protein